MRLKAKNTRKIVKKVSTIVLNYFYTTLSAEKNYKQYFIEGIFASL